MKTTQHDTAVKLQEALQFVNELRIPVVSRDERITLKERAKLARQLFGQLGLKGISVMVATGAWCTWVVIHIPKMQHDPDLHKQRKHRGVCPACVYLEKTRLKLEEILLRAFPRELDRSDMMSDYFDPSWTFHEGTGRGLDETDNGY